MKKVEMSIAELLNFRKEALSYHVEFTCFILTTSLYSVEANSDFLDYLGF